MIGTSNFVDIQRLLVSPDPDAWQAREKVRRECAEKKGNCALVMVVSALSILADVIFSVAFPILGFLSFTLSALIALVSREGYVVFSNIEGMITPKDSGIVATARHYYNRLNTAWSPEQFANKLFQDTWVAGPLFREELLSKLKESS